MNKTFLLFFLCLISAQALTAQSLNVDFFREESDPWLASFDRRDLNGELCAMIYIQCPVEGAKFQGDIIDYKFDVSEYIVWVLDRTRHLKIQVPGFQPLRVDFKDFKSDTNPDGYLKRRHIYTLGLSVPLKSEAGGETANTVKTFTARTDPSQFDLAVSRNGKRYYFNASEWNSAPPSERNRYTKEGVVVECGDGDFIMELNDVKENNTWQVASAKHGLSNLPTPHQGQAIIDIIDPLNKALSAFGGSPLTHWIWLREPYTCAVVWKGNENFGIISELTPESNARTRLCRPLR